MPSIALTILPLAIVAFVMYHGVKAYSTYRKLAHFKGPPLAGWTSLWLAKQAISANMPTAQKEALRIYGLAQILSSGNAEILTRYCSQAHPPA